MRTIVAFIVAPFFSSLVAAGLSTMDFHPGTLFILFCGAFYVLQLLIGMPAYFLLRRAARQGIWIYALLGFGAPALPTLVFCLYAGETHISLSQTLYVTGLFGVLGAVVGCVFWFIARPDKIARSARPGSS